MIEIVFAAPDQPRDNTTLPTLTSILPKSGFTGSTVPVVLTGTNFTTGASVFAGASVTSMRSGPRRLGDKCSFLRSSRR